MTSKVDGLSWTAIGVIAGIALPIIGLLVGMIWRVDNRVERLRDETHREFIAVREDISAVRADISALDAKLDRLLLVIERRSPLPAEPVQAKPSRPGRRPNGNPANDPASK